MLEKKTSSLPPSRKSACFCRVRNRRRNLPKQARGLLQSRCLHVDHNLCHLLSHAANDAPPGRLQLRQSRLDDVRLLAPLEMLTALANPFLAFEDQVAI